MEAVVIVWIRAYVAPPVVVETISPAVVADPETTLAVGPTTAPGCAS